MKVTKIDKLAIVARTVTVARAGFAMIPPVE